MNEDEKFNKLIREIPGEYQENIRIARDSVKNEYAVFMNRMPEPSWKSKGFNDTGKQVWENIYANIKSGNLLNPVSVYIHIPFCKGKKCGFCDCLSVPMDEHTPVKRFVDTLICEIRLWSSIPELMHKPVSVIYFGGGTPNSLPDKDFKRILRELCDRFNVNRNTQISVECTGSLITTERLDFFKSLKVNRLSLGIQTLEEPLRKSIGRVLSAFQLLDKIEKGKENGFVMCGDMIYGLPNQTVEGYVRSIKKLIEVDIDGLSLYRFVVSVRNKDFIHRTFPDYKNDEISNYMLFHMGHQLLYESGYRKNHFIHFVKNDDNLYYRHMLRGEDLIALGPTSDGIVGNYRYRHPHLKYYLQGDNGVIPALEGGMKEPDNALKIKDAATQIMCNCIYKNTFQQLNIESLFGKWIACRIIEKNNDGSYGLTANGSWLVDQLLKEVNHLANAS